MTATPTQFAYGLVTRFRIAMRRILFGRSSAPDHERVDKLWDWVNGMQLLLNNTVNDVNRIDQAINRERTDASEHMDLVIDQLWRRLEAADARLATQVQRHELDAQQRLEALTHVTERIKLENAAILRLIGHEEYIGAAQGADSGISLPIPRPTLFSEIERGSSEVLNEQLRQYVSYFVDAQGPVLDIGCGKGDFLSLLRDQNIDAYGIDTDADVAAQASTQSLNVKVIDVMTHLASLANNSLGGAFASQVVEHLPADVIAPLYEELFRVMKPGAYFIAETPNPATFATHVQSFWRDPTHTRPVPSTSLDFAARSAGFISESVIYLSPVPEENRLTEIELEPSDPLTAELVANANRNTAMLNDLLYGWQDYALVVRKP